jgi:hypothetical protein
MRVDRRQFLQFGAMTVVSASACSGSSAGSGSHAGNEAAAAPTAADLLKVSLYGLYFVEYGKSSATIHILDGPSLGLPKHTGLLTVDSSFIDQRYTAKPDPAHVVSGLGIETWTWDLKGAIAMPKNPGGDDDLVLPPATSAEDAQDVPSTAAGWNSFHRVPDLKTACGATDITNRQYIASSIALTHGTLRILEPGGVGLGAIWQFTSPSGQQIFRGAISDKLEYTCPTNGKSLTISAGASTIVFKPGAANAVVDNRPLVKSSPCGPGCTPNMNHFKAFCKVVDSNADPTITLAAFTPRQGDQAGPDYCPAARICKGC